jgi:hypothetical protein
VKLGFSAEYIENISPCEREVYKAYHKHEENSRNSSENRKNAELVGLDIEDL